MNATGGALLLCDGTDTTLTDGIANNTIVDAVEYHLSTPSTKFLPAALDAGFAGLHAKGGISVERKTAGEDTDNSTVDFDTTTCTPGFEHGSGTASTGMLPDIYPMSLGTHLIYDEYTLDTNGARVPNTLHAYTTTVIDTSLSIGGQWCSAETDSTYSTLGAASATHSYLRNPAGIDVLQYADAQFFSTLLGGLGSFFTIPEQWIQLYDGSAGLKISYPVASLDTSVTTSGTTVNFKMDISGKWDGVDTVTVPAGTFAAYRFKITVHTSAAVTILTLFDNTSEIDVWLARGVGMVKYVRPAVDISALGQSFAQPGSERDLRGIGHVTSVAADATLPHSISLTSAYPNPSSSRTELSFTLPSATRAVLRLYDATGRAVRTLVNSECAAGTSLVPLDTHDLAPGYYHAQLSTPWGVRSESVVVVR